MSVIREALAKETARLDAVKPGLGERMARYVESGEPRAVLQELATLEGVGDALDLRRLHGSARIYRDIQRIAPASMLRFAKCLQAHAETDSWLGPFAGHEPVSESNPPPPGERITADYIERMLVEDELPADTLVARVFDADPRDTWLTRIVGLEKIPGLAEAAARHRHAAAPALRHEDPARRERALKLLASATPAALGAFAGEIAACVVDGKAPVRSAAMGLARNAGESVHSALREIAVQGDAKARVLALEALWELGDTAFVRGREEHEKTRGVLDAILELQARASRREQAQPLVAPDLPVIEETPLPEELRPAFDKAIARINAAMAQAVARRAAEDREQYANMRPVSAQEADAIWEYASRGGTRPEVAGHLLWEIGDDILEELRRLLRSEGMVPLHTVRLYEALRWPGHNKDRKWIHEDLAGLLESHYLAHRRPTLVEVEALLEPIGFGPQFVANSFMWCGWEHEGFAIGWDNADVWPFFARHMDVVRKWMAFGFDDNFPHDRDVGFRAVATFPLPPAEFVDLLFDLALGAAKGDRAQAQKALAKLPDKERRIIAALADRKAEARFAAADWLRALECRDALPALETALRKETNDVCIGAMLAALEALGGDVSKFLDRAGLAKEAAKGLAKGIPSAIEWFPWDAIPEVRWGDSGDTVPPDVLKWFLVQATKLKSPEPQPLLRRYCAMFEPGDRERYGQFVLDAWLAHDVERLAPAEAERLARDYASKTFDPKHYYESMLPQYLRQFKGSSAEAKGALAVTAACAGRGVAAPVTRYLKEYYGTRIHQGKALIAMLAWVDHPLATQAMLSVGHRFRTKQLQEEAMRQAEALAERRGWSVAELADRTMPTAGFDENGELELSYGAERAFTARLGAELKVELCNAEGKKISALPEPRKDEELAKEAKKAFSAAKKDVKAIVQLQSQRLYEALCTERTWRFEDWDLYLNRHPIVRRLLQGLVWVELREGTVARSFRPLDDGTLSDIDDNAVTLDAEARIGLAHDTNLDAAAVGAWRKHLGDYKVATPFQQLGKGVYVLPESLGDETAIPDFLDHVINGLALRGAAGKLGYQRGDPEGRAWVFDYRKRFPSLAIEAVVRFSGNDVYDEDVDVELEALSFARIAEGKKGGSSLRLSAVPAVLLSECYNDMRLIAAAGRGFDPDREKLAR